MVVLLKVVEHCKEFHQNVIVLVVAVVLTCVIVNFEQRIHNPKGCDGDRLGVNDPQNLAINEEVC